MLAWLYRDPAKTARLSARILEALREIGVLLVAFTPLDAVLLQRDIPNMALFLAAFLGSGVMLFLVALVFEWRSSR